MKYYYNNCLFLQAVVLDTILLPADVHLAIDTVDLWVETQQDAKSRREVMKQWWLADGIDQFKATIDNEFDRDIRLDD